MKQYVLRSDVGVYLDDNALPSPDLEQAHRCDTPESCLAFLRRSLPPVGGVLFRVCELTPDDQVVPV